MKYYYWVYILYSPSLGKFYTGQTTLSPEARLEKHNSGFYKNKYTARGKPWQIFLTISCFSLQQAIKIEKHIKEMKSKNYIKNLKNYPEMVGKLHEKYLQVTD